MLRRMARYLPISIPAPREGGDYRDKSKADRKRSISIHAPREGGDANSLDTLLHILRISIHAPREGGDTMSVIHTTLLPVFQSTPPARGATTVCLRWFAPCSISIHAPREGGDGFLAHVTFAIDISIHAPREGGDA